MATGENGSFVRKTSLLASGANRLIGLNAELAGWQTGVCRFEHLLTPGKSIKFAHSSFAPGLDGGAASTWNWRTAGYLKEDGNAIRISPLSYRTSLSLLSLPDCQYYYSPFSSFSFSFSSSPSSIISRPVPWMTPLDSDFHPSRPARLFHF